MDVPCDGSVLLVGDGDFSFSLSLLKHGSLSPAQVTTSNLETSETIQQHKLAESNMREVENRGACVLLEVDARELHNHPVVSQSHYSRIIFNFPLADRHNIKKNRALLADFFSSSSQILAPEGQVMVTLCKGQGGTPADNPQRSWHDSWQALAMAANAGFVLTHIFPFEASRYPEYHSVGFRFQDKSFDTEGSLVHVFEKTDLVCPPETIVARGSLELSGATYSCSHYIAERLKRNLLDEESSPVCWLKRELGQILSECFSSTDYPHGLLDPVLAGYKSGICLSPNTTESGHDDALTEMKKQKDDSNLMRKKEAAASQFAHGVHAEETKQRTLSKSSEYLPLNQFIPDSSETVYVLVKNIPKSVQAGKEEIEGIGIDRDRDGESESTAINGLTFDADGTLSNMDTSDPNVVPLAGCNTNRVFHHRISLLESLPSLCSALSKRPEEKSNQSCAEQTSPLQASGIDVLSPKSSMIVAGQCCRPHSIEPDSLPVHHELIFIHKLPHFSQDTTRSMENIESGVSKNIDAPFEQISSHLLSCLQNSISFKEHFLLETVTCPNTFKLDLDRMSDAKVVKLLYNKRKLTDAISKPIGIILKAVNDESHQYFVTVLNMDSIVCQFMHIPDPRLLWSNNPKVLNQLKKVTPFCASSSRDKYTYRSVSLYPMKFVHDLSFWENSSKGEPFDEEGMLDIIRYIGQDIVVKVSLIDRYTEPETGRVSRCYRLHFQSHSLAFPYAVSWKLQSMIRIEVARKLDVVLR